MRQSEPRPLGSGVLSLPPVSALESPLAVVFAPVAGDPDGAGARRAHPAAIHPEPASATPIPVAVGPDKTGSGSVTDDSVSGGWRRAKPHRRIPVMDSATRQDRAQEGGAQQKYFCLLYTSPSPRD